MMRPASIRYKFITAVLTIHGVYNLRLARNVFGVAQAQAQSDMALVRESTPGIVYNSRAQHFQTDDNFTPLPDAEAFLKAISTVFDCPDYSQDDSVLAPRPLLKRQQVISKYE